MKIAYADHSPDAAWHKDHPMGTLVFQYLLTGEPNAPDNFMFLLARQEADFTMQRHRHNFDQIRLPLHGDMNIGERLMLKEGHVGYFPEGLPYGPQIDPLGSSKPGERLQLVLQFGGSSGLGFMSMDQRKQAWAELAKTGKFVGPVYHRPDGRKQWGLNSVWEKVFGERLKYPMPRYDHVIIADPTRYNWLSVPGALGTYSRYLGAFSERRVWIEMLRLEKGGVWNSADANARRLLYVLKGAGSINGQAIKAGAAIQIDAGEAARVDCPNSQEASFVDGLDFFMIGLPPVPAPAVPESFEIDEGMVPEGAEATR
jgi:hypothetical protein